eukprot:gene19117-21035_t
MLVLLYVVHALFLIKVSCHVSCKQAFFTKTSSDNQEEHSSEVSISSTENVLTEDFFNLLDSDAISMVTKNGEAWSKVQEPLYIVAKSGGIPIKMPWVEARNYCRSLGRDLASINSQAEEAEVEKVTRKENPHRYWLGFNDLKVEGQFEWSDGSPVTYTNWFVYDGKKEPSNTGNKEHCASIQGGKWNDVPCNLLYAFICKRQST